MIGRRTASVAVAALLVLGSAACTSAPETPAIEPIRPGAPGGGPATAAPAPPEESAADDLFVALMAAHHAQGLELARLAAGRAGRDTAVIAARIVDVQTAELAHLTGWLERRGIDPERHAHDDMPGSLSRATLDRAAALDGAEFDRLFLESMIRHHEGAVVMAEDRLSREGDGAITRLARDIAATQSAEIERMRSLLPEAQPARAVPRR